MLLCGRLLEEEAAKRAELEQIHLQQQRALSQTEAEKEELKAEQLAKERDLHAAMQQLERLQQERHGALQQYEVRNIINKNYNGMLLVFVFTPSTTVRQLSACLLFTLKPYTVNQYKSQNTLKTLLSQNIDKTLIYQSPLNLIFI